MKDERGEESPQVKIFLFLYKTICYHGIYFEIKMSTIKFLVNSRKKLSLFHDPVVRKQWYLYLQKYLQKKKDMSKICAT